MMEYVLSGVMSLLSLSQILQADLEASGLVINKEKSQFDPSQSGRWLGYEINLESGTLRIPSQRCERLIESIQELMVEGRTTVIARQLASVAGEIISMGIVIGGVTRLMTRIIYRAFECRRSWNDCLPVTDDVRSEMQFWLRNLHAINEREIWYQPSAVRVVYSDASSVAYGGYMIDIGPEIAHGQWSLVESQQCSIRRELEAVKRILSSWAHKLVNENVKWFTDNQGVVSVIQHGSSKENLQQIALEIFGICMNHAIRLVE